MKTATRLHFDEFFSLTLLSESLQERYKKPTLFLGLSFSDSVFRLDFSVIKCGNRKGVMKKYHPIEKIFKYINCEKFLHSKVKVKKAEVKSLVIYFHLCA